MSKNRTVPIIAVLILAICLVVVYSVMTSRKNPAPEGINSSLANPASVYCEKNGGKIEIRVSADKSEIGYCHLSDATVCEEWSYMRGECGVSQPAAPEIPPSKGKLTGRVLLSPICPVEKIPPDPECAPKPYKAAIVVYAEGSDRSFLLSGNERGEFSALLDPGTYKIEADSGAVLPRCRAETATIEASKITDVTISCDTGIR